MVEIKPGPELNRAVAVALGLTWFVVKGEPDKAVGLYECAPREAVEVGFEDPAIPDSVIPCYSTDLNAAFAAAEKVGLFDEHSYLYREHRGWRVWVSDREAELEPGDTPGGQYVGWHATPALAVCAAILTLKGVRLC